MPAPTGRAAGVRGRSGTWLIVALLSLPVLLWVTRGAPLGTPVADVYDFLYWVRFHRPLELFDSMGAGAYWRPVSRQLYYFLLGPVMLNAPWIAAGVHFALLVILVVVLYRCARRALAPPLAAAVASFPVLARPSRTLLAWPAGGEPLLGMVFALLALHAALRQRRLLSSILVLAAAFSYEQSLLVVPMLVALVLVRHEQERDHARAWIVPALVGTALFGVGHLLAARSGAGVLGGAWMPADRAPAWRSFGPAIAVLFNVEDFAAPISTGLWLAYGALFAAAVGLLARRARRARLVERLPQLMMAASWFVAGMIVASFGSEGWYPWRTMLPGVGLGFAVIAALGLLEPWLVAAFVAVRLTALLLAPTVPAGVEGVEPVGSVRHAFLRLARLQRVVDSARRALVERHPRLPPGAAVRYWALPEMTAWGFDGPRAVRVWYGDSTLTWDWLADPADSHDAVLAFNPDSAHPAVVLEPASLDAYAGARRALAAGNSRAADSLLGEAVRAQPHRADAYHFTLANERALVAESLGELERADSLNQLSWRLAGETLPFLRMTAKLALARERPDVALAVARRCLELAPGDSVATAIVRRLQPGSAGG